MTRKPERRSGLFTRPEDRAADPHMGRAELDRGFEIGAHAHRERVEPVALWRSWRGARNAARAAPRRAGCTSGPAIVSPCFSRQAAMKASASAGITPPFCGSSPVLTCTRRRGARPCSGDLLRQRRRERIAGRACGSRRRAATASRALFDCSGPDQVELDARVALAQARPLRLRLLDVVLAEDPLPGLEHRLDRFGRKGFRHRDQCDPGRVAPEIPRRAGDLGPHLVQPCDTLDRIAQAGLLRGRETGLIR